MEGFNDIDVGLLPLNTWTTTWVGDSDESPGQLPPGGQQHIPAHRRMHVRWNQQSKWLALHMGSLLSLEKSLIRAKMPVCITVADSR